MKNVTQLPVGPHVKLPPVGGVKEFSMSHIEPYEEEKAKKLVLDHFEQLTGKRMMPRPAGYMVAVKIYVRPEEMKEITREDGSKTTLYLPSVATREDKFSSVSALVVALGPQAYKGKNHLGEDRFPEGPWCKVGDFVAIPRNEGFLFNYRGVTMSLLPDDKIMAIIEDPTDVQATYIADRI